MHLKKTAISFLFAGITLVIAAGLWLSTASPASAQCGSQASSCKNCHEAQAEKPVNADGTAWHQSHAFGDFCYICHAGNNQATDKAAAHEGMVAPLADAKASCQQCHAADLDARVQVYAATLGVTPGTTAAPTAGGDAAPGDPAAPATNHENPAASSVSAPISTKIDVNDPNYVDYVQNYDAVVLGKRPVNWGNAILLVMIGMIVVGGGGFAITREKLVNVSFGDTRKPQGEYPTDVIAMLPKIAELKSQSRKSLSSVLENPRKAEKVLGLMDAVISDENSENSAGSESNKE